MHRAVVPLPLCPLAPSHLGDRCPALPIHPLGTRGRNLTPLQLNGQAGYSDVLLEPADISNAKVTQRWPPGLALATPNLAQVATRGADGKSFQGQLLCRGEGAGAGEKQRPLGLRGVGSAWLRGAGDDSWTRLCFLPLAPSESPTGLDRVELVAFLLFTDARPPNKAGHTLYFEPQRPREAGAPGLTSAGCSPGSRATAGATAGDTAPERGRTPPPSCAPTTSSSAAGKPGLALGTGQQETFFM